MTAIAVLMVATLPALAQDTALSGRAKGLDSNNNGVIDRAEARGPLDSSFDEADCNGSGTLDGSEIRAFFTGGGCKSIASAAPPRDSQNTSKPDAAPGGPRPGGGRPPATVTLGEVTGEPLAQTMPVIGRLVARQSGVVASQINGAVVEMRVEVGDRVETGQIIAVLASGRMKAERDRYAASVERFHGMVSGAEAEYRKTQRELQRLDRLRRSAAFSRARYEDLERDVQSRQGVLADRRGQLKEAQALLREAEIDLADTEIAAPFPGVVTEKHIDVGTYLSVGARVVSILNDTKLEAEAEVPSDRLAGLKIGTEVKLRLDDGSVHGAVVRAIVPSENVRTRTRPVRFTPKFGGSGLRLAADQSVTVLVPIRGRTRVVTVHKDAIVRIGADAFVYVVNGTDARRVKVELGDAIGPRFIVRSGVEPGQKIVLRGNETLGRGGPIRISSAAGG